MARRKMSTDKIRTYKHIGQVALTMVGTAFLGGCATLSDFIGPAGTDTSVWKPEDLLSVINQLINWLAGVSILVCIMVMVAAYQLLLSAGSQEGQTRAKDTIRYAAIGLLLVVFSYAIVRLIFTLLAPGAISSVLKQ